MLAVDLALAVGVLLVVPLGARLHPDIPPWGPRVALVAGALAATSVALATGPVAGALSGPLFAIAVGFGLLSLVRWAQGPRAILDLAWPAAFAYLAVGAAWLGADRLDLEPAGFAPPFVQLTAVHFVYAGFASTLMAALTRRETAPAAPRSSATAVILVVGGPPLVALGFTAVDVLLTVGAVVLTAGLYLVAGLLWLGVAPTAPPLARRLLQISAAAVLVPMLLAVHWAAGATFGFRSLSIPTMAMTHGVVNAVGFVGAGLAGWWLLLSPRRHGDDRGRAGAARTGRPRRGTA
jgi:hypothetical protein